MAETERNNLPIAEEPEFTTEIPAIRPDDLVHFTQMNAMLESLLGNDVFLQRLANKMIENSLIAHVLDCENSQMVLGADQGPAITGLIDEVNESVTQLYSDKANQNSNKTITVTKEIMGGDPFDYTKANFVAEIPFGSANLCGYGFHNAGTNGGFLFLDKQNSHLRFKTGGNYYTIPFLEDLK